MDGQAKLVVDGRARCAVELTSRPTGTERTAGEELVRYLGMLGGASVDLHLGVRTDAPVRILVGRRAREDGACADLPTGELRDDGFVFRVAPDMIALVGANDRGTLYAAYEMIERLGVRWYWPGQENEYVPEAGDLLLPVGTEVINPSFRFRLIRGVYKAMMGLEGDPRTLWRTFASPQKESLLDWGVKNRINTGLMDVVDEVGDYFRDRGGLAGLDSVHSWAHLISSDIYYDDHPEYFALNAKGERARTDPEHNHVCTSNPDVVDIVTRGALEIMERDPGAAFVSISQSDGAGFCQCPECLAKCGPGTSDVLGAERPVRTNQMIDYANRVAERFSEVWPDRYVYVLGYHLSLPPPSIPVHPNVMVQLVHYRPNRTLADDSSEELREFHGIAEGWRATGAPLAFYTYNPSSAFAQVPYPAARKFHEDLRWLHDHGFVAFHPQSEGTLWGFYGLTHVSMARTMWNVDLDFDDLQRDYFRALFGRASEPVQAMHVDFEHELMDREPIQLRPVELGSFLSEDVLARANGYLEEAREAETSEAVQGRLAVLAAQVAYTERLMAARRKAEVYRETEDPTLLHEVRQERDAILGYIEANPVEGAYHLAGIRYGIDLFLVRDRSLLRDVG